MNKIKLLIVDDSFFVRSLVSSVISEDSNFEIVGECEDGDEVCPFLVNEHVDVILMDVNMKRMGGVEATKLVLKNFPHVKVVAYSSEHSEYVRNLMIEAGVSGYVYKSTNLKITSKVLFYVANPELHINLPIQNYNDRSDSFAVN